MAASMERDPVTTENVFAGTWMNYDNGRGQVFQFKAGDVVRSVSPNFAFHDAVIAGFDNQGNARLLRPYMYVSSVGTTSPIGLQGYELIDRITPESLSLFWTKIDSGRTV